LVWYKNLDRSFFRFVTNHAFDRQTDRQTDSRTDSFLVARPPAARKNCYVHYMENSFAVRLVHKLLKSIMSDRIKINSKLSYIYRSSCIHLMFAATEIQGHWIST